VKNINLIIAVINIGGKSIPATILIMFKLDKRSIKRKSKQIVNAINL